MWWQPVVTLYCIPRQPTVHVHTVSGKARGNGEMGDLEVNCYTTLQTMRKKCSQLML